MVNINIPITDDGSECTDYYQVEMKLASEPNYALMANQFTSPIELANLASDAEYNVRITRFCCNGQYSLPVETTVNTTPLDAPLNINAVGGDTVVDVDWDSVANAQNYRLERSDAVDFSINVVELYFGSDLNYSDTDVVNGDTYYYRVRSEASGWVTSDWSSVESATPNP